MALPCATIPACRKAAKSRIYYDPMIAKLVTHAPSRAAAIEAQATALDSFYIDGIRHNIPFLSALMNHPRWRSAIFPRASIAEEFPKGFAPREPEGEIARRLAAVAAAVDHVLGERKRQISGQMIGRPVQRERRRAVWLERNEIALEVAREGEGIAVRFGRCRRCHGRFGINWSRRGSRAIRCAGHTRWPRHRHAGAADPQRHPPRRIQGFEVAVNVSPKAKPRRRG